MGTRAYHIAMKKKSALYILLPFFLIGCNQTEPEKEYTFYRGGAYGVFHSYFQWTFESDDGDYSDELGRFAEKVDSLANPYQAVEGINNLYTINNTNDPVVVDPMLFDLMKQAVELYEKTEHNFDPYIGKITSLWKVTLFGAEDDWDFSGPTSQSIEAAKALIPALLEESNNTTVVLDESKQTIQRVGNGTIDLGGITKGYGVEQAERILESHRATRYLLNGGQSSIGLGLSSKGGDFKVSVMYSKEDGTNKYSLSNIDTSTSAIYEQYSVVNDVTYSHIINPKTGMPLTDCSMAFLAGEDSVLLDAFSTSCMIAGLEKTKEWANKYNFSFALFKDNEHYAELIEESQTLKEARI